MHKKETIGTVISNKMDKTITVAVKTKVAHKKYSKIIAKTNKYYAHDANNECRIGDQVKIEESKPISKNKRWILKGKIV
uniref:Small ribosomal subunit protein uS17c n=2 Tax=Grateloupia TaxID=31454 RepID=A0A6F8UM44_9FLOR|nr:30S ribosomal protein S17 [Grateloupia filicina]AWD77426.1 30S ribosomal protein S17 [Grateloupia filicina]BCB15026.1 30S ribosomal protein S17 [Grateloupia asiatica]